jgi:hypothetical protein
MGVGEAEECKSGERRISQVRKSEHRHFRTVETKLESLVAAVESWWAGGSDRGEGEVGKRADTSTSSKLVDWRMEGYSAANRDVDIEETETHCGLAVVGGIAMVVERL